MPYIELPDANLFYEVIGTGEPIKFDFPCMFVLGGNDAVITKKHIEKLALGVKNAKTKIIEECGHGPHLINEKPMLMNNIILEFLEEVINMKS